MPEQKLESELNLSLNLSVPERMMCSVLCSGYNPETDTWKLILLYQGSLEEISAEVPFTYVPLLGRFAIIEIASKNISRLLTYPQILYLELSRPLYLGEINGIGASCLDASPFVPSMYMPPVNIPPINETSSVEGGIRNPDAPLTGQGTVIAVIDSGVDFRHPDFRNPDGTTRILSYWDQSLPYDGTNSYNTGRIFSSEELNGFLDGTDGSSLQPTPDLSGHGTHVAGICAGNGRNSGGRNHGAAPEASLLVVKLKNEARSVYTDYASLMMAVDYAVRFASENTLPLSVNISYGSNDGAHDGNSLIEQYLQNCIYYGRNTITIATGNEGLSRRHTSTVISAVSAPGGYPPYPFPFSVAPGEQNLYLQLWKSPADSYDYQLTTPQQQSVSITGHPGIYRYILGRNLVQVSISESTPYQTKQEVFISFGIPVSPDGNEDISSDSFLSAGIWNFSVLPRSVTEGHVNLWLPSREATNSATGFLNPTTDMTFTIPSSARNVISVSGYDSSTDVFASFSGQGFSNFQNTKPDLCAPAVNILSTAPGGDYSIRTGTSMAAPFVSGSCALLMQWGIIRGNDPFLFGEKVKAALWNGSKALPAFREYPNASVGWGKLCFRDSLPG